MKRPPISDSMKWNVVKVRQCFIDCDKCKERWPIQMIQFDHHLALIDGGAHDNSNIRPICVACHKPKSAAEHKNNAKAKRLLKKHSKPTPEGSIKSRGFQGSRAFNGKIKWIAK